MWNMENVVDGPGAFSLAKLSMNFLKSAVCHGQFIAHTSILKRVTIIIYHSLQKKERPCLRFGLDLAYLLKIFGASWSTAFLSLSHSSRVRIAKFVFAFPFAISFLPQVHAYLAFAIGFEDDYGFPPKISFEDRDVVDDFVELR